MAALVRVRLIVPRGTTARLRQAVVRFGAPLAATVPRAAAFLDCAPWVGGAVKVR